MRGTLLNKKKKRRKEKVFSGTDHRRRHDIIADHLCYQKFCLAIFFLDFLNKPQQHYIARTSVSDPFPGQIRSFFLALSKLMAKKERRRKKSVSRLDRPEWSSVNLKSTSKKKNLLKMHSILEVIRLKQRRRRLGQNLLQLFKFFFIFQHVVLTEAHANVSQSKQSTQI